MNSYNCRRMVIGYISVLLLLVIVNIKGYSQGSRIDWGQQFEEKPSVQATFLKQDALTGVSYWLTPRNGKLFITAFNDDYVKIQTWPLRLPSYKGIDVNNLYFSRVIAVKNKLVFLMHYVDSKSGQVEELIVQGSIDDGLAGESLIHVAKFNAISAAGIVDDLVLVQHSNKHIVNDLLLTQDFDKLIVNTVVPRQGNQAARYVVNAYNASTMQNILSKDYQFPEGYYINPGKNYMVLDNDNNIFFLANKPTNDPVKRDFVSTVIKLNAASDLAEEFPLNDLNGKYITDIGLNISKSGSVTLSGFYRDSNSKLPRNCYSGVFFGNINAGQQISVQTTALTDQEKLNCASPNVLYKNVNYIAKNDGGVILLSEQQFADHGNFRYGNVLVVDLNNDGTMLYAQTLLKNQLALYGAKGQAYYSYYYHYIESREHLLLFYNDNPKNIQQNNDDCQMTPGNAVPVLAMVDGTGKLTTSLIQSDKDEIFCPSFTSKLSDDEFIVWGKKGGMYRLGWLTLNEKTRAIKKLSAPYEARTQIAQVYGLRFRGNDGKEKSEAFTGLNMAAVSSHLSESNGVSVGLLGNQDNISNGISYGTFFSSQKKANGITISPCAAVDKKLNGVALGGAFAGGGQVNGLAIAGIAAYADNVHGALLASIVGGNVDGFCGGMDVMTDAIKGVGVSMFHFNEGPADGLFCSLCWFTKMGDNGQSYSSLKGVVVAGGFTEISDVRGVTVSCINYAGRDAGLAVGGINATPELHGVQLGFLNYAGNNPKALRLLPLVNMHLRR